MNQNEKPAESMPEPDPNPRELRHPEALDQAVVDAAEQGQPHLIEWLLRKRLLDGDICGRALCSAARFGQINVVNLLLKHGSDVHYHNDAPLFSAVDGEHLAIIKVLLRGGATSTVSAVCWAARRGNHRCLALLMSGASWHYHELRHILCHVGAAGVNIVECARIVLRYCADDYLDQCIAKWDESVCDAQPAIGIVKPLVVRELRFRRGSK
jgi:hypothetical protein